MPLHPTFYAEMLGDKIENSNVNVWLINTGWSGGEYGTGSRIKLKYTRAMINAALNGDLDDVEYQNHQVFGLHMPKSCTNVPDELLHPKNTWTDGNLYDEKANELAKAFKLNFEQFSDNAKEEILEALPQEILAK